MSLSNYGEGLVLDALLAEMPFFVALSTTDPGEDGSTITEPTAMNYARKESSDFSRTDNVISNTEIVDFLEASGDWGTITHFAIFDAITVGNMLGSAELDSSLAAVTGKTVQFAIGALTLTAS